MGMDHLLKGNQKMIRVMKFDNWMSCLDGVFYGFCLHISTCRSLGLDDSRYSQFFVANEGLVRDPGGYRTSCHRLIRRGDGTSF